MPRPAALKQAVNYKLKEIEDRPDIKHKVETLKAEIERSGISSFKDLDHELKERVMSVKREIESEFANVIKSMDLDVKIVKPTAKDLIEGSLPFNLKSKLSEVHEEIQRTIEDIVNSSDLKNKMEVLRSMLKKAGDNPSLEQQSKIQAFIQQIKESLQKELRSAEVVEKLEEPKAEVSEGSKTINMESPVIG